MAIPGIIFLVVFSYIPLSGHLLAFKDFQISKGIWGSDWVGLDNFRFFSPIGIGFKLRSIRFI